MAKKQLGTLYSSIEKLLKILDIQNMSYTKKDFGLQIYFAEIWKKKPILSLDTFFCSNYLTKKDGQYYCN